MKLLGCIAVFSCVMLLCSGQGEITNATTIQADNTTITDSTPVATTTNVSSSTSTPVPESTTTPGSATTPAEGNTTTTEPSSTSTPAENSTTTATPITTSSPASGGSSSLEPNITTSDTPGNKTTEPPTTVTSEGPTSVAPTVIPGPDDGSYNVSGNNMTCILAKMDITLNLQFVTVDGTNATRQYGVRDATVDPAKSSNCSSEEKEEQRMCLTFQDDNTITFYFAADDGNAKVSVDKLEIGIPNVQTLFADAKPNQTLTLYYYSNLFEHNDKTKSYKCDSDEKATLLDANNKTSGSEVIFQKVQIQAFRTADDSKFGDAVMCDGDDNVSNVVPIAVGCALAGLVVIVLIAYLVGRRQKRQRGYESV